MKFFQWIASLFSRKKRGSGWDGFKEIDTVIVDKPEEFRDRNNV